MEQEARGWSDNKLGVRQHER